MNLCTLLALLLISSPAFPAPAALIEIGGGKIEIELKSTTADFPRALVTAARAVTKYYGRYPVAHVRIHIREVAGDRISSGRTFGTRDGGVITVSVGRSTTAAHFDSDWLMTHEMVHLAFPSVPDQHHWIEEGLATYAEPIARVRVGNLRAQQLGSGSCATCRKACLSPAIAGSITRPPGEEPTGVGRSTAG